MDTFNLQEILDSDQTEIIAHSSSTYIPPHYHQKLKSHKNIQSITQLIDKNIHGDVSDIDLIPINYGNNGDDNQYTNNINIGVKTETFPFPKKHNLPSQKSSPFSFGKSETYPSQDDWITTHSAAYSLFIRNKIVDFARTVAGLLGLDVKQLLKTGFEDLLEIMNQNKMRPNDLYLSTAEYPSETSLKTTFEDGDFYSEKQRAAILELATLKEVMGKERMTDHIDSLRAYRYLTLRQERMDYTIARWLTLPMNLTHIYFQDKLKAAIETGIMHIRRFINIDIGKEYFAQILESDYNIVFATLVSKIILRNNLDRVRGQKRESEYKRLDAEIRSFSYQMSKFTFDQAPLRVANPLSSNADTHAFNI